MNNHIINNKNFLSDGKKKKSMTDAIENRRLINVHNDTVQPEYCYPKHENNGTMENKNTIKAVEIIANENRILLRTVITVILPILFLGAFSSCPLPPIEDQLVYVKVGGQISNANRSTEVNGSCVLYSTNQTASDAQAKATVYRLFMRYGSSVTTFLFIPLWGSLMDQYGRHIGVISAGLGSIILTGSLLLVEVLPTIPLWILLISEVFHGAFGRGITATVMACSTHVADVIPVNRRIFMMVLIDFIHAVSAFMGSTVVGYIIKNFGFAPILCIMLVLQILLVLYATCVFSRISRPLILVNRRKDVNSTEQKSEGKFLTEQEDKTTADSDINRISSDKASTECQDPPTDSSESNKLRGDALDDDDDDITNDIADQDKDIEHKSTSFSRLCSQLVENCVMTYKVYLKTSGWVRVHLLLISVIILLYNIAFVGVDTVIGIYVLGPPLCWNSFVLGIFTGVSALTSGLTPVLTVLVSALFVHIKTERNNKNQENPKKSSATSVWFLLVGLMSGLIGQGMYALSDARTSLMFVAVTVASLANLVGSTGRAAITELVSPTQQGAAMAGYVLTSLLGEIIGYSVFTAIFTSTLSSCAKCFFYTAAALYAVAIICLSPWICIRSKQEGITDVKKYGSNH